MALAILADAIGDREAQRTYQQIKLDVIANLEQKDPWTITRQQIADWIDRQRGMGR